MADVSPRTRRSCRGTATPSCFIGRTYFTRRPADVLRIRTHVVRRPLRRDITQHCEITHGGQPKPSYVTPRREICPNHAIALHPRGLQLILMKRPAQRPRPETYLLETCLLET